MGTYQDYLAARDRAAYLLRCVREYKASSFFRRGLEANCYFLGENPEIARKTVLRACKVETRDEYGRRHIRTGTEDVVGNRIGSGFLFRFICQQNQYLLQNGVILPPELKQKLGLDFDRKLELLGEKALLHGVSYGFWNMDRLEVLEAVHDSLSGTLMLSDEMTGEPRLALQFWQEEAGKPLYLRLFEEEGVTLYKKEGSGLKAVVPRRPYRLLQAEDGQQLTQGNWPRLPVVRLKANHEGTSELTTAIKSKIDAFDRILSDFADNLDRANDVYWVLNNFGGTTEDIARMLAEISRIKAVANMSDGSGTGSTAEARTIEVPYAARQTALALLRKELYGDYMALDTDAIVGGSLTNVAIRVACANLNLKCDRYEWQVFRFVQQLLELMGLPTEQIRFQRQAILNEGETIEAIYRMRPDISRRRALMLNPLLQPEEVNEELAGDAE